MTSPRADSSSITHSSPHNPFFWAFPLTYLLALLLQVWIRPDLIWTPQFWAEDAKEWFLEAYLDNQVSDILRLYSGYPHLIPRLAAFVIVGLAPLVHVPLLFNIAGLLASTITFSLFVLPEFRALIQSDRVRFLFVIGLLLANPSGEIVGTVTNVQWFAGLGALQVVFLRFRTPFITICELLYLVAAGFSCPTLVFLTIPAIPLFWSKHRYHLVKTVLLFVLVIANYMMSKLLGGTSELHIPELLPLVEVARDLGTVVFSVSLFGYPLSIDWYQRLGSTLPFVLSAFLLGFVTLSILSEKSRLDRLINALVCTSITMYVIGLSTLRFEVLQRGVFDLLLPDVAPSFDDYNHSRYFFIPFCLYWFLALRILRPADEMVSRSWKPHMPIIQILFVLTAALRTSFFPTPEYLNWHEYADKIARGWHGDVPVQPTGFGWTFRIPKVGDAVGTDRSLVDLLADQGDHSNNKRIVHVGGNAVESFFQHPPSKLTVHTTVTHPYLRLVYGLDPRVRDKSDGVTFVAQVRLAGDEEAIVFDSRSSGRKDLPEGWKCSMMDLRDWNQRRVSITFETLPGNNSGYDWALWLKPAFISQRQGCRDVARHGFVR